MFTDLKYVPYIGFQIIIFKTREKKRTKHRFNAIKLRNKRERAFGKAVVSKLKSPKGDW